MSNNTVYVGFFTTPRMKRTLQSRAKREGISLGELIRRLLTKEENNARN